MSEYLKYFINDSNSYIYLGLLFMLCVVIYVKIKESIENKPENFTKNKDNKNLPSIIGNMKLGFKNIPYDTECILIFKPEVIEVHFKSEPAPYKIDSNKIIKISNRKCRVPYHTPGGAHYSPVYGMRVDSVKANEQKHHYVFENTIVFNDSDNKEMKIIITSKANIKKIMH